MVVKYILMFLVGFFSCALVVSGYFALFDTVETPGLPTGFAIANVDAPSDKVSEKDIVVLQDMIIVKVSNATLSSYAPSGSMRPLFDEGANGIRVKPTDHHDVQEGDIVSYRLGEKLIVHRVIEKGIDEAGIYFLMKGDNNSVSDGKIRFEDIEYVTVGVIW